MAKVVEEIVSTEIAYVTHLQTCLKLFVNPIMIQAKEDRSDSKFRINQSDCSTLFSNLENIVQINQIFLKDLQECIRGKEVEETILAVATLFSKFAHQFKMYTMFSANFNASRKFLTDILKDSDYDDLDEFLNETAKNPLCKGNNLASYLIMPVQRIPRYILLLKELSKQSSSIEHASIAKSTSLLNTAISKLEESANSINESIRNSEMGESIVQIQKELGDSVVLFAPGRKFIRRDKLFKLSSSWTPANESDRTGKSVDFYLFSDLMIYKVHTIIGDDTIVQIPLDDSFSCAELFGNSKKCPVAYITSSHKNFAIQFSSKLESSSWIVDVNSCVYKLNAKKSSMASQISKNRLSVYESPPATHETVSVVDNVQSKVIKPDSSSSIEPLKVNTYSENTKGASKSAVGRQIIPFEHPSWSKFPRNAMVLLICVLFLFLLSYFQRISVTFAYWIFFPALLLVVSFPVYIILVCSLAFVRDLASRSKSDLSTFVTLSSRRFLNDLRDDFINSKIKFNVDLITSLNNASLFTYSISLFSGSVRFKSINMKTCVNLSSKIGLLLNSSDSLVKMQNNMESHMRTLIRASHSDTVSILDSAETFSLSSVDIQEKMIILDVQTEFWNFSSICNNIYKSLSDDGTVCLCLSFIQHRTWDEMMICRDSLSWKCSNSILPLSWSIWLLESSGFEVELVENVSVHHGETMKRIYFDLKDNSSSFLLKNHSETEYHKLLWHFAYESTLALSGAICKYLVVCHKNSSCFGRKKLIRTRDTIWKI